MATCDTDSSNTNISCTEQTMIPEFPSRSTILYAIMTHNTWSILTENMFSRITSLLEINLSHNGITQIHDNTFRGLSVLEILNLTNNTIGSLNDKMFAHTPGLQYLYLSNNRISEVHEKTLTSLQALGTIKLSHNQIKHLPATVFRSNTELKEIWIDHNKLEYLNSTLFNNLKRLFTLHAEHNAIKRLDKGTFADVSINKTRIFLSNNSITEIGSRTFVSKGYLLEIDLRNNPVSCDSKTLLPTNIITLHITTLCTPATTVAMLSCRDITCPKHKRCRKTSRVTECICKNGFTGKNCTDDINECENKMKTKTTPCKSDRYCVNTLGSFSCRIKRKPGGTPKPTYEPTTLDIFVSYIYDYGLEVALGALVLVLLFGFYLYMKPPPNADSEDVDNVEEGQLAESKLSKHTRRRSPKGRSKKRAARKTRATVGSKAVKRRHT